MESCLGTSLCRRRKTLPGGFTRALPSAGRTVGTVYSFGSRCLLSFVGIRRLGRRRRSLSRGVMRGTVITGMGGFVVAFKRSFDFVNGRCHVRITRRRVFVSLLFFGQRLGSLITMRLGSKGFQDSCLKRLGACLSTLSSCIEGPRRGPSVKVVLYQRVGRAFMRFTIHSCGGPVNITACQTSRRVPRQLHGTLPSVSRLGGLL